MSIDGIRLNNDISKQPWVDSWLIQRVQKPLQLKNPHPVFGDNPNIFCFGGGLVNGGLSKEAAQMLNKLWRWDYMGASEFEWGAVPSALHAMGKYREADQLEAITLELTGPKPEVRDQKYGWADKSKTMSAVARAVVLCHKAHRLHVIETLGKLACNKGYGDGTEIHLKESSRAWEALFNQPHQDVIGGLELDNGWLYLSGTATETIKGVLALYDIKLDEKVIPVKLGLAKKKES